MNINEVIERKTKIIDVLEEFIIWTTKNTVSDKALEILPETVRAYNELLNSL